MRSSAVRRSVTDAKKVVEVESSKCVGCFLCQMACSFIKHKEFNRDRARITVWRVGTWEDTWDAGFTEHCDACGYCVSFCAYDALRLKRLAQMQQAS